MLCCPISRWLKVLHYSKRLKQERNYWYRAGECKNVSLIYECTYANTLLEIEDPWGKVTFPFCTSLSFAILMIYRLKGALHDGRVLQLQPMRGVEHKPRCRRHCLRSSLSQRNKVSESSTPTYRNHQGQEKYCLD